MTEWRLKGPHGEVILHGETLGHAVRDNIMMLRGEGFPIGDAAGIHVDTIEVDRLTEEDHARQTHGSLRDVYPWEVVIVSHGLVHKTFPHTQPDIGPRTARIYARVVERAMGRPEIGGRIAPTQLGEDLRDQVDAFAKKAGATRSEAIRVLINLGLNASREATDEATPYTVTVREISNGIRETKSRHRTLGAAVEALRKEQEWDQENNGLPSYQPRVEFDGRPVDTEATV